MVFCFQLPWGGWIVVYIYIYTHTRPYCCWSLNFKCIFKTCICIPRASLVAQRLKRLPTMQETQVRSLGWEDPLEKEMATHSSTRAWRIPWREEPGRLQSMGSQRVGHDWATSLLEKAMAPHSSTLAWKIPWAEEPGRLQSMGSLGDGHDWVTSLSLFTFMHWRRKWHPTPVFLPGESRWWGSLVGCHLWGCTESDMTEAT